MTEPREQILDAAERCLTRMGPSRTRHLDIAEEAGVSRPTVYKHVGDRKSITRALLDRELDRFMTAMLAHVGRFDSMHTRFVEALVFSVQYAGDHALFQRLLTEDPEFTLPWLTTHARPLLTRVVDEIEPQLAEAVRRGEIRQVDTRVAAEWTARLGLSLITTPSVTARLDRPRTLRLFIEDLFTVGLADRPPTH